MALKQDDVLVVGAGQAGIPLANHLAERGKRVALAEQEHLGGSCVNFGCTPSKAGIASARIAHLSRRAEEYGIRTGKVTVDFFKVLERAQAIAEASRISLEKMFATESNPELLWGHASLAGRDHGHFLVMIDATQLAADNAVLNTGARSQMPDVEGLDQINIIDSENWLQHRILPKHVLMIGGGYIGLEMGQFYRRMGSAVTIVQGAGQIAPHEDPNLAASLQAFLEQEGIHFRLNSRVRAVRPSADEVIVRIESDDDAEQLECSDIFVAAGRQPNTGELGLESVGLQLGKHGFLEANEKLQTNVPGMWAAGDIRGGPMFTRTSWDDFRILPSQLYGDGARTTERVIPYAIFTDPELGRVGMTEQEARKAGHDIRVGRFDFKNNGKAKEIGETAGFIKVIAAASSGKILGAAVLGPEGAELVHMYVDLMNADAPYSVMENAIHIHPTLAEAVQSAVAAIQKG
jgi:pyruvate/2-oxoglutarate dehydrogenase complex dihydrolipoamide dehydrogenase (E3) component